MANINTYIRKYKNKSFEEEPFNEVDNLIFSSLVYLNFDGIIPNNKKYVTLNDAGKIFLNQNTYLNVSKYGIAHMVSYGILKSIVDTVRYKDILVYNYFYIGDINKQFGAMCFKVKKNFIYVAFEGTDNLLSGWKEDFQMAYEFPVPSQKHAINYLNKNISFFDKNVIVGGHSKGGNLALVACMYCKKYIRKKIKLIYSNDGPGLRKAQMESVNYKSIRDRYIHIIPNYCYVGILLRNDKYKVIKSSRRGVFAHSLSTWQIDDNKLKESELSNISKNLEESVIMWLDKHDDLKREKMIITIFNALEESGIYDINDFGNIKKIIMVIKYLKNIDQETKDLVLGFIHFNFNYLLENM
ncbi:MAG: DUF2974 domain-containing protein [Bacilli bacterium]|nr:DUF2974 domain-containing protein [Bacilli bacterium]